MRRQWRRGHNHTSNQIIIRSDNVETGVERMGWSQEQQDTCVCEHTQGWVTHLAHLRDYLGRQRVDQAP
jgi:hypothetical protein